MGLVTAKLEETAAHVVALSILLLNLRKIQCAFLRFLDWLIGLLLPCENLMVNQSTLFINQILKLHFQFDTKFYVYSIL